MILRSKLQLYHYAGKDHLKGKHYQFNFQQLCHILAVTFEIMKSYRKGSRLLVSLT